MQHELGGLPFQCHLSEMDDLAAWGFPPFFYKLLVNADPRSWQRNQWMWGIVLYF